MAEKSETKRQGRSLDFFWGDSVNLEQVHVDHAQLARINDQYYVTFGQVRPPATEPDPSSPSSQRVVTEIRPVVRIIAGTKALRSMAEMILRNMEE